jgi:hypothetical protein
MTAATKPVRRPPRIRLALPRRAALVDLQAAQTAALSRLKGAARTPGPSNLGSSDIACFVCYD